MTEYTVMVKKTITIKSHGKADYLNTVEAKKEALRLIKDGINMDWLEIEDIYEYKDYEKDYEEVI